VQTRLQSANWRHEAIEQLVLGIDTLAVLYYCITAESITTVAHLCAVLLGAMLSTISKRLALDMAKNHYETSDLATTETPLFSVSVLRVE
jgi:hypothetical protein